MRRERSFGAQWIGVRSQHLANICLGYAKLSCNLRWFDACLKCCTNGIDPALFEACDRAANALLRLLAIQVGGSRSPAAFITCGVSYLFA
jgi:hypothetical protein